MKKFLLLAVVFSFTLSSPALAAIVYSGSQNVTLELSIPIPNQITDTTISIADSGDTWDDFHVNIEYGMSTGLYIEEWGGTSMGVPMLVGLVLNVSNLGIGTLIGPGSF